MQPNPSPHSKLIVLEGLDGAGTTSQSAHVANWLRGQNVRVHVTREPSQGPAGAQIRAVLSRRLVMDSETLAALFVADRLDHLYSPGGVIDRLMAGEWVVMDRYYLSSFAYQKLTLNEEKMAWLDGLHEPCIIPDVTFFLSVPVEICLRRVALNRGFHFELFERQDVLEEVHQNYLAAIAKLRSQGELIYSLDGTRTVSNVRDSITAILENMYFNPATLATTDAARLFTDWPLLAQKRKVTEETLGLVFVCVRGIPASSYAPYGGCELVFANDANLYYVVSHFDGRANPSGPTVRLYINGRRDKTRQDLEDIWNPQAAHNRMRTTDFQKPLLSEEN